MPFAFFTERLGDFPGYIKTPCFPHSFKELGRFRRQNLLSFDSLCVSPSFESPTASSDPAAGKEPLQPPVQTEPYRALPRSEEKRTEAHAYGFSKNVGKFVGFPVTLLTHESLDARAKDRGLRAGPRSKDSRFGFPGTCPWRRKHQGHSGWGGHPAAVARARVQGVLRPSRWACSLQRSPGRQVPTCSHVHFLHPQRCESFCPFCKWETEA